MSRPSKTLNIASTESFSVLALPGEAVFSGAPPAPDQPQPQPPRTPDKQAIHMVNRCD